MDYSTNGYDTANTYIKISRQMNECSKDLKTIEQYSISKSSYYLKLHFFSQQIKIFDN